MNRAVVSAAVACVVGSVAVIAICACRRGRTKNDVQRPPENLPEDPSEKSEGSHTQVDTKKAQEIYFGDGGKQHEKDGPKSEDGDSDNSNGGFSRSLIQSQPPAPTDSSVPASGLAYKELIGTGPTPKPGTLD